MNPETLLVHYHEVGLKGRNRPMFEHALRRNLAQALGDLAASVRLRSGRLEVLDPKPEALSYAARVFGVANVSPAFVVPADLDAIVECGIAVARDVDAATGFETFAVRARRARTGFAHDSGHVNRVLGEAIRSGLSKRVDLSNPELTVRVEIFENQAYVSGRKVEGPGGLPVGTTGPVVSLLSAGIDSPVATWRLMKRGADPIAVHFHSEPFTDPSSRRKVQELLDVLRGWGYRREWWSVPMGEAQREISLSADPSLRILLYRRLMLRVAERIAAERQALAVVTGESLGQVASQTLENLHAVGSIAKLEILRPLIGVDKIEIIAEAERIGTYRISAEPHQDCCTLFEPRNPVTRCTPERLDDAEQGYDVDAMVADCFERADRVRGTARAGASTAGA